jgi:hypothetical protein
MNRKPRTLEPPKPPRRGARNKVDESVLSEARDFLNSILREGRADWFEHGGVRIGAVWMQAVTRDVAQEWLNRVDQEHQRKRQEKRVKIYASDISADYFRAAVPMVIFDQHARLINGQHMLGALLKSNRENIILSVQINLVDKAYQAIDENRKRTARDTLRWNGVERPGEVAGVAKVLFQFLKGYYAAKGYVTAHQSSSQPTNAEVEAVQQQYPEILQHLWKDPGSGGYSIAAVRAASVVLMQIDSEHHKKFFTALIEGVGIKDSREPVAVLRAAMLKAHMTSTDRGGWRCGETMLRVFKAWNQDIRGEGFTGPLYRKGEPFQDPMGPFPVPESTRSNRRVQ